MKKLLFTLVALLTCGTSLADSFCYIDEFEVQSEQIGTRIKVPVRAYFEARVQAWQVRITQLPEGLTVDHVSRGGDMRLTYLDEDGYQMSSYASLNADLDSLIITCASTELGYWQPDGSGEFESYGFAKWEPGEYYQMFYIYFNVDWIFEDGTIELTTIPYSDEDARGGTVIENGDNGQTFTTSTHVCFILPGPDPVISFEEEEDYLHILVDGEGDLAINITNNGDTYYIDGSYGHFEYDVPRTDEAQFIEVYVDSYLPNHTPGHNYATYNFEPYPSSYDFEEGGIFYKIIGEGKVGVSYETRNYNSYSGNVVIPATVTHEGVTYKVTAIEDNAFYDCAELTGITIGSNVSSIGNYAFMYCTSLTQVTLPNYVVSVGTLAFAGCTGLSQVILGSGVARLGAKAFVGCTALTSVISKPATPPTMSSSDCFACYETATLTVHPAAIDSYQAANYWKLFTNIVEVTAVDPPTGDTNGDGVVNISDVTALIDMLLNGGGN